MFCKWCGLESETTDVCSWCRQPFTTPSAPPASPTEPAESEPLAESAEASPVQALPEAAVAPALETIAAPPDIEDDLPPIARAAAPPLRPTTSPSTIERTPQPSAPIEDRPDLQAIPIKRAPGG